MESNQTELPLKTEAIVRREEELLVIRRVRKVEEMDADSACTTDSQIGQMGTETLTLEAKNQMVQNALGVDSIDLSCEKVDAFLMYLETEQEWAEVYRRLAHS